MTKIQKPRKNYNLYGRHGQKTMNAETQAPESRVKAQMLQLKQLNLNIYLSKLFCNLLLRNILLIMMTEWGFTLVCRVSVCSKQRFLSSVRSSLEGVKACLCFKNFFLVLMKLRLNVPVHDLAYRCGVSLSPVSRTFSTWLTVMNIRLSPIIRWPERDELWHTMPLCFQFSFEKKNIIIIECFEIFIERPSNLLARAQTFLSITEVFYPAGNTTNKLFDICRENWKNPTYWQDDQGFCSPYKSFPICWSLWVSSSAFVRHLYLREH